VPIPRSAPVHRLPPGARRAGLLAALEAVAGPATVADLAATTGLHPNTVRAHLDVLVREGRVTRRTEQRTTRGRPRELYEVTGAPDPSQAYASLALLLAEQLAAATSDPAAEGERMGRRWAAHDAPQAPSPHVARDGGVVRVGGPPHDDAVAPPPTAGPSPRVDDGVRQVVRVLRRAGFAPELSEDGTQVLLHACPFREVAAAQPTVVCQAHLGLIRATLDRAGSSVVARAIQPFVAPDLCVASFEVPAGATPAATGQ
jgi:predicted ArsR family transcriptional regulator